MENIIGASARGDIKKVRELLKKEKDINRKTRRGSTSLHKAASNGHFNIVDLLLLQKGIEIDGRTEDGLTPLHKAAKRGRLKIMRRLAYEGAKIETSGADGKTPRERAENKGYKHIQKFIDGEGKEIEKFNERIKTLFIENIEFKIRDILPSLKEKFPIMYDRVVKKIERNESLKKIFGDISFLICSYE